MTYPKEFKEAISNLPSKEKDKLILRLLKKDLPLTNRLMFELINPNTVDEQREVIKKQLLKDAERAYDTYYSPGFLKQDVGYMSGNIRDYVYTTKDKFGEVYLNLIMINKVLELNSDNLLGVSFGTAWKFCIAVVARTYRLLILIQKLDDDYFIEFEDLLKELGSHFSANDYLMRTAIRSGLDVNWLLSADIPDDITVVYKEVKGLGLLK